MPMDFDETIHCACFSDEHQLRFVYFKDLKDPFNEVYCSFHLQEYPWYKRIWVAIKYMVGYKSKIGWGHWGEVVIAYDAAKKIRNLMDRYINDTDTLRRGNQGR